jgi:hypothetical protein
VRITKPKKVAVPNVECDLKYAEIYEELLEERGV